MFILFPQTLQTKPRKQQQQQQQQQQRTLISWLSISCSSNYDYYIRKYSEIPESSSTFFRLQILSSPRSYPGPMKIPLYVMNERTP